MTVGLGLLTAACLTCIAIASLITWLVMDRRLQALAAQLRERAIREQDHAQHIADKAAAAAATQDAFRAEFENLSRQFLDARQQELRAGNSEQIGALLKPLSEKIDSFQHRVNQVHTDMVSNNASLTEQIKQLESVGLAISSDATNLTQALKGDKKLVGNWGEAQLQQTLELAGLRSGEHFEGQASFKDETGQRYVPDFVIRLPQNKHLVIDSKVSLVDYEAAVAAQDGELRDAALTRHTRAVKAHIDSLAEKAYALLPGMNSPDFVLMFMPVEPAYIEVMRQHRDLFAYGYQKGVVMVSHTTLMPIMRTVANLWLVERGTAEAQEISDRAGEIFNAVSLVAERLESLGTTLQTATKKYNQTVTAMTGRQGLRSKVERFEEVSAKANRAFPDALSPLTTENDGHLLRDMHNAGASPSVSTEPPPISAWEADQQT